MSTFISYAQNLEDVLIWRALSDVGAGFYIDVGANSPLIDSVSLAFYERGWNGVNIEPSLMYHEQLRKQRPRDLNIHAALGATHGLVKFFDVAETGLSTLVEGVAKQHADSGFEVREDWISILTLDDLFGQLPDRDIHWMKIDVEGAEELVLQGWKQSHVRPWLVVLEGVEPKEHAPSHLGWEPGLLAKGYKFVHFDGLSRYYLWEGQAHRSEAFKVGPNLFDRFALSGTATSTFASHLNEKIDNERRGAQLARDELHAEIQAVHAEVQAGHAEKEALEARLEYERTHYERRGNAMQLQVVEALAQMRAAISERDEAAAGLMRQRQHLADAEAEIRRMNASEEDALSAWRQAGQMLEERTRQLQAAQGKVQELLDSSSWKATAPLRGLVWLARGSRQGAAESLRETLRYLAQIPLARQLARRLVPENSRLKRALVSRIVASPGTPAFAAAAMSAFAPIHGGPANRHGHLLNRLERRLSASQARPDRRA